jgi:hypothetical protein
MTSADLKLLLEKKKQQKKIKKNWKNFQKEQYDEKD